MGTRGQPVFRPRSAKLIPDRQRQKISLLRPALCLLPSQRTSHRRAARAKAPSGLGFYRIAARFAGACRLALGLPRFPAPSSPIGFHYLPSHCPASLSARLRDSRSISAETREASLIPLVSSNRQCCRYSLTVRPRPSAFPFAAAGRSARLPTRQRRDHVGGKLIALIDVLGHHLFKDHRRGLQKLRTEHRTGFGVRL